MKRGHYLWSLQSEFEMTHRGARSTDVIREFDVSLSDWHARALQYVIPEGNLGCGYAPRWQRQEKGRSHRP